MSGLNVQLSKVFSLNRGFLLIKGTEKGYGEELLLIPVQPREAWPGLLANKVYEIYFILMVLFRGNQGVQGSRFILPLQYEEVYGTATSSHDCHLLQVISLLDTNNGPLDHHKAERKLAMNIPPKTTQIKTVTLHHLQGSRNTPHKPLTLFIACAASPNCRALNKTLKIPKTNSNGP